MARTRGAAKKAVDDSAEDVPFAVPDEDLVMEKPVPKPRRMRSRRGKNTVEEQQETDEQEVLYEDTVAAEEGEADGGVGEHEEPLRGASRSRSRTGKGRGRKDNEKPQGVQLVSFPSIMDEGVNAIAPAPLLEPYIPKPRYTPTLPAAPKRVMSSFPPKTPKFDPEIHGKDLEKDLQEDDGIDTFEQLIKRSPKKKPVNNKSLDMPAPLDLEAVQVTDIKLPAQTEEERKILTEEPAQIEGLVQVEEPISEVKALEAVDKPKGRVTRKNTPAVQAAPLTVKKTHAASSIANPVTTTTARRGKHPETVKTTSPPASPPRADLKKAITSSTSSKAPVKKSTPITPPRAEAKGKQTTPTRTVIKSVTTSPPRTEKKKPAPGTFTRSPRPSAEKTPSTSPKPVPKPTASASPPRISPKQPTPSSSPWAASKRPTPTPPPRADAKKALPASQAREATKKPAERPIAKPVPRKLLGAAASKAPFREKKSVVEPPSIKEVLPIRVKRVASGPVPPTKRIRPTPPVPRAAAEGSQNASAGASLTPRSHITSLNKSLPPARASKPPTKPTGFRLVGEEVARKQAEAKEARKKRMEEAEAVKASLKEKEANARKPIPSKTSSIASKSSRDSNVSSAVNRQLERELASTEAKKAEEPTKPKTSSPPRPGQPRPIKPPAIVPRPALVIQKKAPTTKLTTATSKPAGHASGTVNGTVQLTPEQEDIQRKERITQAEKLRKQAAERGKVAILAWATQQKNKQPATPSSTTTTTTTETKQSA